MILSDLHIKNDRRSFNMEPEALWFISGVVLPTTQMCYETLSLKQRSGTVHKKFYERVEIPIFETATAAWGS